MPSTKGDPTDPELRQKIKDSKSNIGKIARIPHVNAGVEIQSETGGGWAAWKVSRFLPNISIRLRQIVILPFDFPILLPGDVAGQSSRISPQLVIQLP